MSSNTTINTKETKKLISLRLPIEYIELLKIMAKEEHRTLTNYILKLVARHIINSQNSETDFLLSDKMNRQMLLKSKKEAENKLYSAKNLVD